jgi:hypothetical protein
LLSLSLFPIIITPLYWFFGYAAWYPQLVVAMGLILGAILVTNLSIARPTTSLRNIVQTVLGGIYALPVLAVVALVLSRMSGDTLYSPWSLFGLKFWLVVAIILFLLIIGVHRYRTASQQYLVLASWYLLVYTMIVFTHKHAFGFDQHIHLASLEWIRTHGMLEPKVPYYLGQYFLALPLAEITNLSLDWVNRLIVPLGAAATLPLILLRSQLSMRTLILLPLLPLSFLTFTTPNNLALLLSLSTILWLWIERDTIGRTKHIVTFLLTAWTLITHALIGVPLVAAIMLWYSRKWWQRAISLLFLLIGVPLLLALYGGGTTLVFEPHVFLQLFAQPHWYVGTDGSLLLKALYAYKMYLLAPVIIAITVLGAWRHRRERAVQTLTLAALGVLGAAFLIAATVRFPALIAYEQISYAGRLLSLAIVFILPLFLLGLQILTRRTVVLIMLIPLLLISWHFTYPTRDKISYYTGVSIRDADVEAIAFIDEHAAGEPYIVLTNQMVSAAALSRFGFEGYRTVPSGTPEYLYAIPTGGPLYRYFREYIYEGYNRRSIDDAMEFAGVHRAYIIHTNYWAPAAEIRDVTKEVADAWWELGGARVWVYLFEK